MALHPSFQVACVLLFLGSQGSSPSAQVERPGPAVTQIRTRMAPGDDRYELAGPPVAAPRRNGNVISGPWDTAG